MILIALGANLSSRAGTPANTLAAAIAELAGSEIETAALSPFYLTPAWPDPNDPAYVNAVARIETKLAPQALLGVLQQTEQKFGRARGRPNAPRTLDLDMLDYDGLIQDGPPALPHPRMQDRGFVLVPLGDVAPTWRHPVSQKTVWELIAALPKSRQTLARLAGTTD
jgi:2-amino-4-hydroxy-6-hydroxymethyldihydropteridine diphosphokinase